MTPETLSLIKKAIADTFNQVHYSHQHPDQFPIMAQEAWEQKWILENVLQPNTSVYFNGGPLNGTVDRGPKYSDNFVCMERVSGKSLFWAYQRTSVLKEVEGVKYPVWLGELIKS